MNYEAALNVKRKSDHKASSVCVIQPWSYAGCTMRWRVVTTMGNPGRFVRPDSLLCVMVE